MFCPLALPVILVCTVKRNNNNNAKKERRAGCQSVQCVHNAMHKTSTSRNQQHAKTTAHRMKSKITFTNSTTWITPRRQRWVRWRRKTCIAPMQHAWARSARINENKLIIKYLLNCSWSLCGWCSHNSRGVYRSALIDASCRHRRKRCENKCTHHEVCLLTMCVCDDPAVSTSKIHK